MDGHTGPHSPHHVPSAADPAGNPETIDYAKLKFISENDLVEKGVINYDPQSHLQEVNGIYQGYDIASNGEISSQSRRIQRAHPTALYHQDSDHGRIAGANAGKWEV